jgi:hypothetical protein
MPAELASRGSLHEKLVSLSVKAITIKRNSLFWI